MVSGRESSNEYFDMPLIRNRALNRKVRISHHALLRFSERAPQRLLIDDEFSAAMPFGGQYGDSDFFLLGPHDIVFVIRAGEVEYTCLTVMDKGQAEANLQSTLIHVRDIGTHVRPTAAGFDLDSARARAREDFACNLRLISQHQINKRKAKLLQLGFTPQAIDAYLEAYWECCREDRKAGHKI